MRKPPIVLLVNPWIYDFAAYDFWARPLGLLSIAGVLRKNNCIVHFIDCLAAGTSEKEGMARKPYGDGRFPKEQVEKPAVLAGIPRKYSRYGMRPAAFQAMLEALPRPDVVLVTSLMTYWYPGVIHVIRLVKQQYPGVPILLGGIYATLCHEHALRYSGADTCIKGEGERTVLKKVGELTGWEIASTPDANRPDSYPYPAFDLLDHHELLCIMTSRGCPYKCSYCASSLLGNGFRQRDPSCILDELAFWIDRYAVRNVAFYDDALLYRAEERIVPLLKGILKRGIACFFHTPNGLHARAMTPEIAELMFQTGFKTIRLGLETADDVLQQKTGGKVTCREFERAVRCLREAGYDEKVIGAYLLIGLPGQKIDEVRRSITYVRDCGARPFLAEYSPLPGTGLWEEACRHSPFDLNEPLFHNNSILPCRTGGLTWEEYYQLKREVKDDT